MGIVAFLLSLGAPDARGGDLGLEASAVPDGPGLKNFRVHIPSSGQAARVALFLRQSGATELGGVRLAATSLSDEDGAQLAATAGVDPASVTIPPAPGQAEVALTVRDLDRFGTFTATVFAERQRVFQTLRLPGVPAVR